MASAIVRWDGPSYLAEIQGASVRLYNRSSFPAMIKNFHLVQPMRLYRICCI